MAPPQSGSCFHKACPKGSYQEPSLCAFTLPANSSVLTSNLPHHFTHPCPHLLIYLPTGPSTNPTIHPPTQPSIYLSTPLNIHPSTHPPTKPLSHPSTYLPLYPAIYLSSHLPLYQSIHLPNQQTSTEHLFCWSQNTRNSLPNDTLRDKAACRQSRALADRGLRSTGEGEHCGLELAKASWKRLMPSLEDGKDLERPRE